MIEELRLQIQIAAKPATVFRFFEDPERFRMWMGAQSTMESKPKGSINVAYPNGDVAVGEVESVVPGKSIVFTWGYKDNVHGLAPGSTRVSVELEENESGTKVTLRHQGLDAAQKTSHEMGWRHYLAQLSANATAADLGGVVDSMLEAYFNAWAEHDVTKRDELLKKCFAENAVFTDQMGYAQGRKALSDYIGGAQKFAGDMKLEKGGPAIRVHGNILVPWKMVAGNGNVAAVGQNYAELNGDGLIVRIVGFWTL